MSDKESTEQDQAEETKGNTPSAFPSPVPALIKASDQAQRPGFRSPANKGTKAQSKKKGKGRKKR